jgi:hypothetical protein
VGTKEQGALVREGVKRLAAASSAR